MLPEELLIAEALMRRVGKPFIFLFFLLTFNFLCNRTGENTDVRLIFFLSDGHNQDAIIAVLITIRRRTRKREGRKKWFNDFLQECTDCSPSSQLRSIVECALLLTQTLKHMCAWTHTGTARYQRRGGLTAGSSKLERINLVGKWSLIGDRNQATACVCVRVGVWKRTMKRNMYLCAFKCFMNQSK